MSSFSSKSNAPWFPSPSPWPTTKAGVIGVAESWYDPNLVRINEEALKALPIKPIEVGAEGSMVMKEPPVSWAAAIQRSIALNSINFQFWDVLEDGRYVRYQNDGKVGALAMKEAFDKAWNDKSSPFHRVLAGGAPLGLDDIEAIFGDIPSPSDRADVLNEMLDPFKLLRASEIIERAMQEKQCLSVKEAAELAKIFPLSYGDEVLKKAQLALSETWVQAQKAGWPVQADLTAFADYQIPNVLRHLGVLSYSEELAAKIDRREPLDEHSAEERAIRGASVLAMEKMALHYGVPVAALDHFVWTQRNEVKTPFHLTYTLAY
jgi:hypothetical protein